MTTMNSVSELQDSSGILDDVQALRRQVAEDGYVFVRAALPSQLLWDLRSDIAAILGELGWISGDPMQLLVLPQHCCIRESDSVEWRSFYNRVQCLRSFHALAHAPELRRLMMAICGTEVLIHPRHICRLCFPQSHWYTTPAHQDYYYIRGTQDTWTAWLPVGECSKTLGSLAVLPGSHLQGLLPVESAQGAGGKQSQGVAGSGWAHADFNCGDVLCMHSLLIHQGQDNQSLQSLRLSVDIRFQNLSQAVHPSSLQPHMNFLDWPEIYHNWDSADSLRYYWKDLPLRLSED